MGERNEKRINLLLKKNAGVNKPAFFLNPNFRPYNIISSFFHHRHAADG
jgi:hypothetical protein